MALVKPQVYRSSITGNIPASGVRQPGELWVNFADFALGVIDASRNAQRITAVRYFQTTANYAVGDFVIQAGALYVANTAVTAGAFSLLQWNKIATAADIPGAYVLPTASTTILGGVKIDGSSITIASGVISSTPTPPYILPPASITILGGVKVDGTTITATGAGVISAPGAAPAANPNRLDNGDMWVDQHNGGATVAIGAGGGVYAVDRFWVANAKAKFTAGQNYAMGAGNFAPGFSFYLGVQVTGGGAAPAAADQDIIVQNIELDAFADFMWGTARAQPAMASFWVCSSLTGNFSFNVSSLIAPYRQFITTYNIPTANVWTKIVIPIPGDTVVGASWGSGSAGNAPVLQFLFDLGCGANAQTSTGLGAWQTSATTFVAAGSVKTVATSNAKFAITGVKLELGSVATPYPVEGLAQRLLRCQRYYQVLNPTGLNVTASGYTASAPSNIWGTSTLLAKMRAAPTVAYSYVTYANASSLTLSTVTPDMVSSACASTAAGVAWAGGQLNLSAEI